MPVTDKLPQMGFGVMSADLCYTLPTGDRERGCRARRRGRLGSSRAKQSRLRAVGGRTWFPSLAEKPQALGAARTSCVIHDT